MNLSNITEKFTRVAGKKGKKKGKKSKKTRGGPISKEEMFTRNVVSRLRSVGFSEKDARKEAKKMIEGGKSAVLSTARRYLPRYDQQQLVDAYDRYIA